MPSERPPYDAPEDGFGPDADADEARRGASLIVALDQLLAVWEAAHPEARMSTLADALLYWVAGTLFHLWQDAERAMPEPPIPWAVFVAGMQEQLAELLAQLRVECRCGACRPPNHG